MLKNTILLAGVAVGVASLVACSDDESTSASKLPEGACTMTATEDEGVEIKCGNDVFGVIKESADGVYGASCAAEALKDDSGYKIICAGDSVGVVYNGLHGRNGEPGSTGAPGTSCKAEESAEVDGFDVICGDEVIGYLYNGIKGEQGVKGPKGDKGDKGEDGEDGDDCTVSSTGLVTCGTTKFQLENGENGDDCSVSATGLVTCGETTFQLKNGENGEGCSVSATGLVTCGEDEYQLKNGTNGVGCSVSASGLVTCGEGDDESTFQIENGVGCSATQDPDTKDVTVTCGKDSFVLNPGDKGDDGVGCTVDASGLVTCSEGTYQLENGADGDDCSVDADGLVTCGETSFLLKKGDKGDGCSVSATGLVTCGEETFQLKTGDKGAGCSVSASGLVTCGEGEDESTFQIENGVSHGCTTAQGTGFVSITCEDADGNETTSYLYAPGYDAVCGDAAYDSATQFCYEDGVYEKDKYWDETSRYPKSEFDCPGAPEDMTSCSNR